MKLFELVEDTATDKPLAPGETRARPDLTVKNVQAIQDKIDDLLNSLLKSQDLASMFLQDAALQSELKKLSELVKLKVRYLTRMKTRPTSKMDKMWNILDNECSEFLHVIKSSHQLLYRGLKNQKASVYQGRSSLDRPPRDSKPALSRRLDQALAANGFQALRSNSIFTTSSASHALGYGDLYCIFPKNGFHVLTTNQEDMIIRGYDTLVGYDYLADYIDDFKLNLKEWLSHQDIRLQNKWERKIASWYVDNLDYWLNYLKQDLEIPEEFKITINDIVTDQAIMKHLEPRQDDLKTAMQKGREICIHGEYWALKAADWQEHIINHYLGGIPPIEK